MIVPMLFWITVNLTWILWWKSRHNMKALKSRSEAEFEEAKRQVEERFAEQQQRIGEIFPELAKWRE